MTYVHIGSRESLSTEGTPFFVGVSRAGHGGGTSTTATKKPVIENSKQEPGDMENERPDSEGDSQEDTATGDEDDHSQDDPTTWFQAIPGKRAPGRGGIQGLQPRPARSRRSRFSLATTKRPRVPPKGNWPEAEAGADVTI